MIREQVETQEQSTNLINKSTTTTKEAPLLLQQEQQEYDYSEEGGRSRSSLVDESCYYEGRPMAPPKRQSNNGDSSSSNNNNINNNNNTNPMVFQRKQSHEAPNSNNIESLRQKPNLKSDYELQDEQQQQQQHRQQPSSNNIRNNNSSRDIEYALPRPTTTTTATATTTTRRQNSSSSNNNNNNNKPAHPPSVYACRQRGLALFAFVSVFGGLAAAVTLGMLNNDNNDNNTLSNNNNSSTNTTSTTNKPKCSFCFDGTTPTGLTQFSVDELAYCEQLYSRLTTTDLLLFQGDGLCVSGQALAWHQCGCSVPPPMPPSTTMTTTNNNSTAPVLDESIVLDSGSVPTTSPPSTKQCSLCPNGAAAATTTTTTPECRDYAAFVANRALDPTLDCHNDILAVVKADCACGGDDGVDERYRQTLQNEFGSVLLDPESAQHRALLWITERYPSFDDENVIRIKQRYALVTFYMAMGKEDWLNGAGAEQTLDTTQPNICDWDIRTRGIGCNARGQITQLNYGACFLFCLLLLLCVFLSLFFWLIHFVLISFEKKKTKISMARYPAKSPIIHWRY